jgi:hypothetical protein
MNALAQHCKVYCLLGNHDIYMKNSVDINSMIIFNNIKNVKILDSVLEASINGNKSLFVPWLGDVSKYNNETFDMMFGHFDVSSKYLIKSYIEDHSANNKLSDKDLNCLSNDEILSNSKHTKNAGDFIGDFVDVVKINGSIFSGHIHGRKEFLAKHRRFIFVGDPYQQNLGEKNNVCGFYVINEDNSYEFHEITSIPKHVEIRISEVIENFESYDFSKIKGNILHKIYDVEIDNVLNAKINQKINDWQPYEELLPDYDIDITTSSEIKIQNESIALIKKSKLEYIKTYIDNIDEKVLIENNINTTKLYKILTEYYNLVAEEK